ncbi:MAG TPA: hypothetical protein GXX26_03405 [Clostridiaceae bacterium]|nr:hypothetical protein [Clostridiaceae bacterium]
MEKTPRYKDIPPKEYYDYEMADPIFGKTFDYESEPAKSSDEKKHDEEPLSKGVRHKHFEMAEDE